MTGRTVDRPVRNPDRYRTGPDRTGPERPVAGTGSIYASRHIPQVSQRFALNLVSQSHINNQGFN